MVMSPRYNRPLGVGPDQFAQTLAQILTMEEREKLRRSGDWEAIQREGFTERRRERQDQRARQLRESKLAALGASPGVGLVGFEEARGLQQERRERRERPERQARQLREQQRMAMGAQPGVGLVGIEEAQRQQQGRQEQALEEEARRQFGYYSQVRSQDPYQQQFSKLRQAQERRELMQQYSLPALSLGAPQRELSEMRATGVQIREVLARQRGEEEVQMGEVAGRVGEPPQPNAMATWLVGLEGESEETKYRVAKTLQTDSVLRAEVLDAAGGMRNPAFGVLKDYYDESVGIVDVAGVLAAGAKEGLGYLMNPVVDVNTGSKWLDALLDIALSPGTWLLAGFAPGLTVAGRLLTRPLLRRTAAFAGETVIGTSALIASQESNSLPAGLGVGLMAGAIILRPKLFLRALHNARLVGARHIARGAPTTVRRAGLDVAGAPASTYMTGSRYSPTHQVLLEAAASLKGAPAAVRPAATRLTAAGGRLAEAGGAAVRGAPATARGAPMAIRRAIPTPGEVAGGTGRLALGGREAIEATAEAAARRGRAYATAAEEAGPQYAQYMYGRPGQLAAAGESAISRIPMIRRTGTALDEGISARPGRKLFGQEAAAVAREATEAAAARATRPVTTAAEEAAVGAARAGIVKGVAQQIPSPGGKLPDEYFVDPEGILQVLNEAEGPLKRLGELLHQVDVPGMRKVIREAVVEGRGKAAGEAEPFWRGGSPEQFLQGKARLEGEIVTDDLLRLRTRMGQEIGPLRTHFTTDEVQAIYATTTLLGRGWDVFHAQEALMGLVFEGVLPTGSRLRALELAVGPGIVKPLLQTRRSLGERGFDVFMDLVGLPRSLLASTDLSALLRQGLPFTARDYYRGHFKPMLKAAANEKYARIADLQLRQVPIEFSDNARQGFAHLEWLDMPGVIGGTRSQRAEEFTSNLADRLPLVKQSNRAYTYSSNAFRAGWYKNTAALLDKTPGATLKDYMDAANWANVVSGRGNLPRSIRNSALGVWLNNFFFSPRFLASRIQILTAPFLPKTTPLGLVPGVKTALGPQALGRLPYVSAPSQASRVLRKEIARDLVNTYGMIASGLGLAKLGGFDVNLNPTHADFGKATFGDLKLDFSAGFGSVIRLVAQIGAAQRIKAGTGEKVTEGMSFKELFSSSVALEGVLARFSRGKLAPPFAFLVDVHTGQTIVGDEVTAEEMLKGNLMPITGQDIWTAFEEQGFFTALAVAPAAILGIGVGNYARISELQERAMRARTGGVQMGIGPAGPGLEVWNEEQGYLWGRQNRALRNDVNKNDPDVRAALEEMKEDLGSEADQISTFFSNLDSAQEGYEADAIRAFHHEDIPVGFWETTEGRIRKREIIREMKGDLFGFTQGLLFNEHVRERLEEGFGEVGAEDVWALQYRTIELETDEMGDPKYLPYREAREILLGEAIEVISKDKDALARLNILGVTIREYITGEGPNPQNTYGVKTWVNPEIRNAVAQVEFVTDTLEQSGFFELTEGAWAATKAKYPTETKGFLTYYDWVDSIKAGSSLDVEATARIWQTGDVPLAVYPVNKNYQDALVGARSGWITNNRKNGNAALAVRWGFINPSETSGQEGLLEESAGAGVQP